MEHVDVQGGRWDILARAAMLLTLLTSPSLAFPQTTIQPPGAQLGGDAISHRVALYEGKGGASCSHFLDGVLAWKRRGGDWVDNKGVLHGPSAYSVATRGKGSMSWNVLALVDHWLKTGRTRGEFFIRTTEGSGYAELKSREASNPGERPILVLEFSDGRRESLEPTADTYLSCSTYTSLGQGDVLVVTPQQPALLEFRLPAAVGGTVLKKAQLMLSERRGNGNIRIGVFETAIPDFPNEPVQRGIAAGFPNDAGIDQHPDVVFATGFDERTSWRSRWGKESAGNEIEVVGDDPVRHFDPLSGKALRVNLKKGSNYGADLRFYLNNSGAEPDELYFRYYVRLANDWSPNIDGGKMPGLAGIYGKAGWGGRRANGDDGWSARGSFMQAFPVDHPMHGLTQLGSYVYHADMKSYFGDGWNWPGALLTRDRWYCVEQHVRLNRPGSNDGVLRVWLDGRLVMNRTDIRFRTSDRLHIEMAWLNIYHGGTAVSPIDQHLYIDNVVLARRYIGPMPKR